MSLTKEQYDGLMQVIRNRRSEAYKEQNRRQEEVERQIPAVRVYDEKIAGILLRELEAGLGRSDEDPAKLRRQRELFVRKKTELLEKHGFGRDYLEMQYTCGKCRDTGYIGNEKCGCFRQLESELLNRESGLPARLMRENFGTFDQYVYDDIETIPELSITQYEYMTDVVMRKVIDFVEGFEEGRRQSILMTGPAGTGKTFLSNCIAKRLMETQHSVIYERAGEMFDLFSDVFFSKKDDGRARGRLDRIEKSELLIIDDLGTEYTSDFSRSRLFTIISNRLSSGLSTIISTNLSLNQLSSVYGERLTSRFIGEYILLPFYGSDLRVNKAGGKIR